MAGVAHASKGALSREHSKLEGSSAEKAKVAVADVVRGAGVEKPVGLLRSAVSERLADRSGAARWLIEEVPMPPAAAEQIEPVAARQLERQHVHHRQPHP